MTVEIYDFANNCQKRLRDILRGSGYTSYINHPDTSPPASTLWIFQGKPEKDPEQPIMITITKPEPTHFEDSSTDGSDVEAETELQTDLFVTGISGSGTPRSDYVRRILVKEINRTILTNKKSFRDLGVNNISFSHFDNDNPDDITDRHTVFRITFKADEQI